ncbi:MAG: TRAP transporter small permease subunit [Xanthobacteraceae bacterium]
MRRALEASADAWGAIQRYAAALLMIFMTALYGFNVLVRAVLPQFASTFAWIDEAARYILIWVVFLAAGIALEGGRHVLIDLLWGRFGAKAERWLFVLIDVVGFAFSVLMVVLSIQLTIFVARSGQISPTLGVPAYVLYVAPAVGFASLAFGFLLRLLAVRDARRTASAASRPEGI